MTTNEAEMQRRRALGRARLASAITWGAIAAALIVALASDQAPVDAIAWGELALLMVIAVLAERSAIRRARRVRDDDLRAKTTSGQGSA